VGLGRGEVEKWLATKSTMGMGGEFSRREKLKGGSTHHYHLT
jgi:hypothetical protein